MTREIVRLSADDIPAHKDSLVELLCDAVAGGASVNFITPFSPEDSALFWDKVSRAVAAGEVILLIALEDGELAGSVQLGLAGQPNGHHRAEVQKLLVHSRHRRKGIAQALMAAIEDEAVKASRSLLVLDTVSGSDAERLYPRLGYNRAGSIPAYALSTTGIYEATVIFYKQLTPL